MGTSDTYVLCWTQLLPDMGVIALWNGFLAKRMEIIGIGGVEK